jgi:hypothetical protein
LLLRIAEQLVYSIIHQVLIRVQLDDRSDKLRSVPFWASCSVHTSVADSGAAGSRRRCAGKCTAILPLLLARRDVPLIIDQPEDNLDNHFIYETIVDSIRRNKPHRQLIFVTHNANIPVLGDAELVVVLESSGRAGFVAKKGTLDECGQEIIDLLEGGREAFELRSQRYRGG